MPNTLVEEYRSKHRHPLNRATHLIGIPLIVAALPVSFVNWRWGIAFFLVGWMFQFIGHIVEGNQPAFFHNPLHLIIGPWWLLRRIVRPERKP